MIFWDMLQTPILTDYCSVNADKLEEPCLHQQLCGWRCTLWQHQWRDHLTMQQNHVDCLPVIQLLAFCYWATVNKHNSIVLYENRTNILSVLCIVHSTYMNRTFRQTIPIKSQIINNHQSPINSLQQLLKTWGTCDTQRATSQTATTWVTCQGPVLRAIHTDQFSGTSSRCQSTCTSKLACVSCHWYHIAAKFWKSKRGISMTRHWRRWERGAEGAERVGYGEAVSYTHLTLPTKRIV